jgi:hypothetical protein
MGFFGGMSHQLVVGEFHHNQTFPDGEGGSVDFDHKFAETGAGLTGEATWP